MLNVDGHTITLAVAIDVETTDESGARRTRYFDTVDIPATVCDDTAEIDYALEACISEVIEENHDEETTVLACATIDAVGNGRDMRDDDDLVGYMLVQTF